MNLLDNWLSWFWFVSAENSNWFTQTIVLYFALLIWYSYLHIHINSKCNMYSWSRRSQRRLSYLPQENIDPTIWFSIMNMFFRNSISKIGVGRVPVSWLDDKYKPSRFVRLENEEGMDPVNLLFMISKDVNLDSLDSEGGKVPEKKLELIDKKVSFVRAESDNGKSPKNLFLLIIKSRISTKFENISGILPWSLLPEAPR